jgi:hypothetical protein
MMDSIRIGGFTVAVTAMLLGPLVAAPPDPAALSAKIDQHIGKSWTANGVTPAPTASDAEFLRRVSLDLGGRIPHVNEVRDFLADSRPNKRQLKIE